jgi:uroporphyrinogen-III synthase
MKLIVTRPMADAEALVPKLKALGHEALLCPLMEIRQRSGVTLPKTNLQAVCASSANGLNANLPWEQIIHLPFIAVGPQSAEAARQRGFTTVHIAEGGNLQSLAALIGNKLEPTKGAILYLSGVDVSGDLATLLQPKHIKVERLVVYEAIALEPLDLPALIASADGVLLYSPRAARLWVQAVSNKPTQHLRHFCLSPHVAAQLPQSAAIWVAEKPDESGMFALLDRKAEAE